MSNENKQNTLEIQKIEQKYKEQARQAWRDSYSQNNEGGVDSVGFITGWIAGRKQSEAELNIWKIDCDKQKEHARRYYNQVQDRDQRIGELSELVSGFLDWFNDPNTKREPKVLLEKATAMLGDRK